MTDYYFPLIERKDVGEGTMAFRLDTRSAPGFSFRAGQCSDFTLENPPETDAEGNTRTFSIASSPTHREDILFATRMRPSAFKKSLASIPLGTQIKVGEPGGSFTLHKNTAKPAVFLAGGIGITPVRSIVEWATSEKSPHSIYLFYSNRTAALTAFLADLAGWQKENPHFHLIATLTGPADPSWSYESGRIDPVLLKRHLQDLTTPIFYISGPPAMVAGLRQALIQSGADEDNIRSEEFSGY
jgi:ferredoxin-NADP reductase